MKTTQYGLSARAGGWDPDGDSGTDQWQGNRGNTLNLSSCALTESAEEALSETLTSLDPRRLFSQGQMIRGRLAPGTLLKITYPDARIVLFRTFDDRAPESDPRLDIFNPFAFNHGIPDMGNVEVAL